MPDHPLMIETKMAAILLEDIFNAFSWMQFIASLVKFDWNMFTSVK